MTIQIAYKWARNFGLSSKDSYRVARTMATNRGTFTQAMISAGFWTDYRVWA